MRPLSTTKVRPLPKVVVMMVIAVLYLAGLGLLWSDRRGHRPESKDKPVALPAYK